jgi:hypothetical protein
VTPFVLGFLLGAAAVFIAARARFFLTETTGRANAENRPRSAREPRLFGSSDVATALRRRRA